MVSKTQTKRLTLAVEGALTSQRTLVRKTRSIAAAVQIQNDAVSELVGQVDIIGRSLQTLQSEIAKAFAPEEKKEKSEEGGPE